MKKTIAILLGLMMVVAFAGCNSTTPPTAAPATVAPTVAATDAATVAPTEAPSVAPTASPTPAPTPIGKGTKGTISLYTFTNEVPNMIARYVELHPDFAYTINPTIIATTDNLYEPALDQALAADAVDFYCCESAFVLKYTQGDASNYAIPYADLGIDVASELKAASIAQYTVDIGTRPADSKLVGLAYQATGSAMIYRRSLAKDTWGTDDPAKVAAKVGPGWDKFFAAAKDLSAKGYAIVSGDGDIWHSIENSSDKGWLTADGKLFIDPKRLAFLDYSKQLKDNVYENDTQDWTDAWYADMAGTGAKKVFSFFGPAWLINYVMAGHSGGTKVGEGTYGDWAVCNPPVGFFWGGTWLLADNATLSKDADKKAAVKTLIDWITLDCTKDGLQYGWANGTWSGTQGTKDTVSSGTVMAMSDGKLDFLGGQNMFDVFVPANQFANGKNLTQYDGSIDSLFRAEVRLYTAGTKTKDEAIAEFKQQVKDTLGIDAAN